MLIEADDRQLLDTVAERFNRHRYRLCWVDLGPANLSGGEVQRIGNVGDRHYWHDKAEAGEAIPSLQRIEAFGQRLFNIRAGEPFQQALQFQIAKGSGGHSTAKKCRQRPVFLLSHENRNHHTSSILICSVASSVDEIGRLILR